MRQFIRRYFLLIFIFFLIVIAVLIGLLYRSNTSNKNSSLTPQTDSSALIEKIGKLVFLPQDETPTVAVVSDPSLLKDQPFFIDAKKGDQVLIYTNARKAILYDPVANKIVNMASLNIGGTQPGNIDNNQLKVPAVNKF